jgi:hypothetical protein
MVRLRCVRDGGIAFCPGGTHARVIAAAISASRSGPVAAVHAAYAAAASAASDASGPAYPSPGSAAIAASLGDLLRIAGRCYAKRSGESGCQQKRPS